MRKLVLLMTLTFVLIGMLGVAFKVQRVEASGTVYIRADGSVDPPTAPISTVDNVTYTFTDNINESIVVERSNIIIDGNGYTLNGTGTGEWYGFTVEFVASNVTIQHVNIMGFVIAGIRLISSSNNSIYGNNITGNSNGIYLAESMNTTISGNNITNNNEGIYLWDSSNNTISGNTLTNNYVGIYFESSSNNSIYHNNFINNTNQVSVDLGDVNTWDDGYPSGGNYWSNYPGVDLYSGPGQNETGSDGIGDTPYIIDADNQDRYPFMSPWGWDVEPPSIGAVSREPEVPDDGEKVTIIVDVTDGESGVRNVTISYSTDGGETWNNVTMEKTTRDTYEGEIPGLPAGTNVQYKIIAYDKAGNFEVDDQLGQYYVYTVIPEFPTWTSMLLILIVLTVAIAIYKRRLLKTPIH